jgi:hypothetical protein
MPLRKSRPRRKTQPTDDTTCPVDAGASNAVRPVFPGKLTYAEPFARPPQGLNSGVFVITPNGGLLAPSIRVTLDDLARLAKTDIDPSAKEFREPLQKDAKALGPRGEPILLGSIATRKYADVLHLGGPSGGPGMRNRGRRGYR